MRTAPKKYYVVDTEFRCIFVEAYGLKNAKRVAANASEQHKRLCGEEREYLIMTPEEEGAYFAKHHGGATKTKWDALKRDRRPAPALAT